MAALWTDAAQLLSDETGDANDAPFHSLICNHGAYRNLPHAHLNLRFDDAVFANVVVSRWDERRREAVARLVAFNADAELARNVIGGGRSNGGGC